MFALGVAVISANRDRSLNISNLLFGNILGVDRNDLILVGVVVAIVAVVLFTNYKPLLATTHNPAVAAAHGCAPAGWRCCSTRCSPSPWSPRCRSSACCSSPRRCCCRLRRVVGVRIVRTAHAWCRSRSASLTAIVGLYISYYHDIASGPAIVLTGAAAFAVLAIGSPIAIGTAER